MSETRPVYGDSKNGLPQTIQAFRNRPCALPYSNEGYVSPGPEEVDALIKIMNSEKAGLGP